MIEGVVLAEKKQIKDDRGMVMHWLRSDASQFKGFGEIYFSEVNEGIIKAWKFHHERTQNLVVPFGQVRFVIYDIRENSPTKKQVDEHILGRDEYKLLTIPPGVWYGFEGLGSGYSLIGNCTDEPFKEGECERLDSDASLIPYKWRK